uniref:DUF4283 domain-containing protein n=1 Tax=Quercus lobata TaxID=97700 RepID=A0A7N2RF99_QUELO
MDSDFIERLRRVSLTSKEGEVIHVRSKHRKQILEECSLSPLGRFLTTKPINLTAAKNLLRSVWKMDNDLKMTDVGDRLIQFKFAIESQLVWVLNNGPWSSDNHLLLLRRWEKGMIAFSVNFQYVLMWVQVWGLPFDHFNKEAGRDIGRAIGRVIEVDCKAIASDQARFLRIRVEMPIDKPIQRGAPVLSPEGDQVWVAFQYERLLGLCFHCGLLGHESKVVHSQTRAPPTPPRRDQGDTSNGAPPPSGHNPETVNPPPVIHVINDSGNGPIMMHTEFNRIENNPENHGARLMSVPISYVDNVESKESETLANTSTRESRDTKKKPHAKNLPRLKKIPRPEHDSSSKPMVSEGLVGKKRTCEVENEVVEERKRTKTSTMAAVAIQPR